MHYSDNSERDGCIKEHNAEHDERYSIKPQAHNSMRYIDFTPAVTVPNRIINVRVFGVVELLIISLLLSDCVEIKELQASLRMAVFMPYLKLLLNFEEVIGH